MSLGGPQLEPSLAGGGGLPRLHSRLRYNLCRDCLGCNGTGKQGQWYEFEAESMFRLLTDKQRLVMSYRLGFIDGKGWKQHEIAKFLDISQPAVHKHERLARKKLENVTRHFFDLPQSSKTRVTTKGYIQADVTGDGYISIHRGGQSFQLMPEREGFTTDDSEQPQLKQTAIKGITPWRVWLFECYPNGGEKPELWWVAQNGGAPLYAPSAKRLVEKIRVYSKSA